MLIVSITGSVAVGKSTLSHKIQDHLRSFSNNPSVEIISTDGFLYSADYLKSNHLMSKKGFPESFDQEKLIEFICQLKSGVSEVQIPVYSHDTYDLTGETRTLVLPEIVILEGVNAEILTDKSLIDFSIYLDAPIEFIQNRYLERFKKFRNKAKDRPDSFFHQFSLMPEDKALDIARHTWKTINEVNLREHIEPFKVRADWKVFVGVNASPKCSIACCMKAGSIPTKIAVVLYGFPLLCTLAGALIGYHFGELQSILGAAVGLIFSFFALRACQRFLNRLS